MGRVCASLRRCEVWVSLNVCVGPARLSVGVRCGVAFERVCRGNAVRVPINVVFSLPLFRSSKI